jgi:glucosyl-3-phosphoglycerate phosphatase
MLSGMTARLVLIRHGESTWNAEERLQGQMDPPLSDLGREQTAALLPFLDGFQARRVVWSDLERARETGRLLGLEPDSLDPRWREIDLGAWSGKRLDELQPSQVASWRRGVLVPPRAESWPQFQTRVAMAAQELATDGGALVVTHGGCIRAACAHFTGADPRKLAPPANASVTILEVGARVRLESYGLRAPGPETPGLA